jgi:hypothetical protein
MEEINGFIAAGLPPNLPFLAVHYHPVVFHGKKKNKLQKRYGKNYLLAVQVLPVEKLMEVILYN